MMAFTGALLPVLRPLSTVPVTIRQVRQTTQPSAPDNVLRARAAQAVQSQRAQRIDSLAGDASSTEKILVDGMPDWNAVVSPLMAALSTSSGSDPTTQRAALQQIQMLSRQHDQAGKLWQKYFGQIMLLVLESLKAGDSLTREAGLVTIMDMVRDSRPIPGPCIHSQAT